MRAGLRPGGGGAAVRGGAAGLVRRETSASQPDPEHRTPRPHIRVRVCVRACAFDPIHALACATPTPQALEAYQEASSRTGGDSKEVTNKIRSLSKLAKSKATHKDVSGLVV
jgi:hypothetical protein